MTQSDYRRFDAMKSRLVDIFQSCRNVRTDTASFDAEFVGLSLSYGLSLNAVVYFAITVSCAIENRMVSVERIKQFTNIPSEAPWRIKDCLPSPNWPTKGDIDIIDLKVHYSCTRILSYHIFKTTGSFQA